MVNVPRGGRRRYILVLLVLTALTLATLDQRSGDSGPIGAAGRLAHHLVQPVANAADTVFSPVSDWWSGWIHSGDLKEQNRSLRRRLADALARQRDFDIAVQQNQQFRKLFGEAWLDDYPWVGARVVSGATGNFDTSITLNAGTEHHVVVGMAVIAANGLVGTITDSWNGGSKVKLITDPTFGAAVRMSRDNAFGTAGYDSGRLTVVFDDVVGSASKRNIGDGDFAITCGCNGSDYPLGIPVGEVVATERTAEGAKLTVVLRPFLDITSLDVVKIVLWTKGDPIPRSVVTKYTIPTTSTTTTTSGTTTSTRAGG